MEICWEGEDAKSLIKVKDGEAHDNARLGCFFVCKKGLILSVSSLSSFTHKLSTDMGLLQLIYSILKILFSKVMLM